MSVVEVLDDGEPAARARDPDEVRIKCAWLKQKKVDDETKLPLLDFDEQTQHTFNRRKTTFRMVKHSCSYPAPPHKVRMWCSSLGAAPDLPPSMDLNMFINTFELITEEKHTLEMAHLTGGETIAFEMVQGEQLSELSTFLLGSKAGGAQIKPKIVTVDKRTIKQSLTQSVQKLAEELEAERAHARGEPPHAPLSKEEKSRLALVLKEQAAAAELERKKMADELIAEEEEEARRREKKKAKKKGKKEKQREKKKAGAANGAADDDDEEEEEEEEPPTSPRDDAATAAPSAGGACASCCASSKSSHRQAGSGGAAAPTKRCANGGGAEDLAALVELGMETWKREQGGGTSALQACLDALPDDARRKDDVVSCLRGLQSQVARSHEMISLLVRRCLEERASKEAALQAVHTALEAAACERPSPAADAGGGDSALPAATALHLESLVMQITSLRRELKQSRRKAAP